MSKKIIIIFLFFIIFIYSFDNITFKKNVKKIETKEDLEQIIKMNLLDTFSFNERNLILILNLFEIQHSDIVFKKAKLESGNFKSKLFEKNNNLFGMKYPTRRETFAKKFKKYTYAYYDHWIYSVADYKLWQGNKKIKDYYKFILDRKYSQDKNYLTKLKSI